jgi:hypothetical protein
MTQEILYRSPSGIVLASDSLVIHISEDGRRQRFAVRKLFRLGQRAALVTAGAFAGVRISEGFARTQEHTPLPFEQLALAAERFFEREYGRFIEENRSWFSAHPQAYRSLYVLLAGLSQDDGSPFGQTLFLSSEEHRLPFQSQSTGEILTIPRRLGLEGQLMLQAKRGTSLEDVAAFCHWALGTLAEREPEQVGGPFHVAILDEAGFRWSQPRPEESG